MLFRLIAAVASASFIAQGAIAQLTPDQVVADMNTVASISRQAESVLGTITQSSSDSDVQNAATVGRGHLAYDDY
jgi:ABC-type Fe3+-citrate transport system substrate-binding protein